MTVKDLWRKQWWHIWNTILQSKATKNTRQGRNMESKKKSKYVQDYVSNNTVSLLKMPVNM